MPVGVQTLHYSDSRWKMDITSETKALATVQRLRGVTFAWRRDHFADMNFPEGRRYGLIAQEAEEVLPELVHTARDGYESVEYANLVAVLIEAIKELQAERQANVKELATLTGRVNSLDSMMRIVCSELDGSSGSEFTAKLQSDGNEYQEYL